MSVRDATEEDFEDPMLTDPAAGVFHTVPGPVMDRIKQAAKVRLFVQDEPIFEESQPSAECPLSAILTGSFSVTHLMYGQEKLVTMDIPSVVVADAEYFVRGVPESYYWRGKADTMLSTVRCVSETGSTLQFPMSLVDELDSARLTFNIAKLLTYKLLQRNAVTDPTDFSPPLRIVHYLHTLVMTHGTRRNLHFDPRQPREHILDLPLRRSQVAAALRLPSETVRQFILRLVNASNGSLLWDSERVEMSEAFKVRLISLDPSLWQDHRELRN